MTDTAHPQAQPEPPTPHTAPKPARLYFCGTLGTLLAFSVYYLRNVDVVEGFHAKHGGLGGAVAMGILLIGSGVWSIVARPRDYQAALLAGLGFPGLIFAVGSTTPAESTGEEEVRTASLLRAAEGSLLGDAMGLIFTPVRATVETRIQPVQERAERIQGELAVADRERSQLTNELTVAQRESRDLASRLTTLNGDYELARAENADTQDRLADLQREYQFKSQELVTAKRNLDQLEQQVAFVGAREAEVLDRLAAHEVVEQELEALRGVVRDYEAVLVDAGPKIGMEAGGFLFEIADSKVSPQVRVAALRSLSKLPERPSRTILRGLEQLETSDVSEVQEAARNAVKKIGPPR